jgi:hypothetical protein
MPTTLKAETDSQIDSSEQQAPEDNQEPRFKFNPAVLEFRYGKTESGDQYTPEQAGYDPLWSFGQTLDLTYRDYERKWYDQGRNTDFSRQPRTPPIYAVPNHLPHRPAPVWGENYQRSASVYSESPSNRPGTTAYGQPSVRHGSPAFGENSHGQQAQYGTPATDYGHPTRPVYQEVAQQGIQDHARRQPMHKQHGNAPVSDAHGQYAPRGGRMWVPSRLKAPPPPGPPPGGWRDPPPGGWKDEFPWDKHVTPGPTAPGTRLPPSTHIPVGLVGGDHEGGSRLSATAQPFVSASAKQSEQTVIDEIEELSAATEELSIAAEEFTMVEQHEGVPSQEGSQVSATEEGSLVSAVSEEPKTRSWADDSESDDEDTTPQPQAREVEQVMPRGMIIEIASIASSEPVGVDEPLTRDVEDEKAEVKERESIDITIMTSDKEATNIVHAVGTKEPATSATPVPTTPVRKGKAIEEPVTAVKGKVEVEPVAATKPKESEWTTVGRSKKSTQPVSPVALTPRSKSRQETHKTPSSWANIVSSPRSAGPSTTPRVMLSAKEEQTTPNPVKVMGMRKMYIAEVPQGTTYAEIMSQMRGGLIDDAYVSGLSPDLHLYTQAKGRAQPDAGNNAWFGYVTFYDETGLMRCIEHLNNVDHKRTGIPVITARRKFYQLPGVPVAFITLKDRRIPVFIRERDQRPLQEDVISAVTKFNGSRVLMLTFKKSIRCKAPHTGNVAIWEAWQRAFTKEEGKEALQKIGQAIQVWKGSPEVYTEAIELLPTQAVAPAETTKPKVPKTYLGAKEGETFQVKITLLRISVAQKVLQMLQQELQFRDHCAITYAQDHCAEEIAPFEKFQRPNDISGKKKTPKLKKKKANVISEEEFPSLPSSGQKKGEHVVKSDSKEIDGEAKDDEVKDVSEEKINMEDEDTKQNIGGDVEEKEL